MIVPLKLHQVAAIDLLANPELSDQITINSPALSVFTDFKEHYPFDLNHKTTAKEARLIMSKSNARLRFIVDDADAFIGIVTLDDLSEQKIIQKLASAMDETDIIVTDFMQSRQQLMAFDYSELCQAKNN